MAQKKKSFPVGSYGYRVQKLMIDSGMNSADLYDVMLENGTDSKDSKYTAVRHALGNPNYQHVKRLHEYFQVSADYLLGFDKEHTGLSEEAENRLQAMNRNHPSELKVLDLMLRDGSGFMELLARIAEIERFCHRKAELQTTLAFFNREAARLIDTPCPKNAAAKVKHLEECRQVENSIRETEAQLKAIGNETAYLAAAYDASRLFSNMLEKIMPEDKYLSDPDAVPFEDDLRAEGMQQACHSDPLK